MIRSATLEDAEAILAIYAPYILDTAVSFETEVPQLLEFRTRMAKILEKYPWLVSVENGEIVGYAYASAFAERSAYQWSAIVSVYLSQTHTRKGLGKQLYTELLEELRVAGLFQAFGGITLPNEASVGLHESFGFKSVGVYSNVGYKFGTWHDVGWWQLQLRPLTVPAVVHSPK